LFGRGGGGGLLFRCGGGGGGLFCCGGGGDLEVDEAVEGDEGLGGRLLAFLFEEEIVDGENDDGYCD